MIKRIDKSPILLKLIEQFSNFLARKRGLPMVLGITFVALGFGFQIAAVFTDNTFIEVVGVISHNLGVLIALIGILLAIPLGK